MTEGEGSGMPGRILQKVLPLLGVALLAAALWTLHRELEAYSINQIMAAAGTIASGGLEIAVLLTFCDYAILTLYDFLALSYAGHRISYARTAFVSFVSYAFSHNLGMTAFSGGSVRFHLYGSMGLSLADIGRLMAFSAFTGWLGYGIFGGSVFLSDGIALPSSLHAHFPSIHLLGLFLLALSVSYMALILLRNKPFHFAGVELPLPSLSTALAQAGIGSLDWFLASWILFSLLPAGVVPYTHMAALFLLAQIIGIVSQIPGGLGVFETVIVLSLGGSIPKDTLIGALLVYRGIYYILPLCCAILAVTVWELLHRSEPVATSGKMILGGLARIVPYLMVLVTFFAGVILLFSGALPVPQGRLAFVQQLLPLPVVEVSHFLSSLAGMGLLILSRGIWRRIDTAWLLSVILLGTGAILSILKGFRWEEALFLALIMCLFLPAQRHFHRHGSLLDGAFSWDFILSIGLAMAASLWLGFFAFRHEEYSQTLWWRFALDKDAPRFLRAQVGAAVLLLFYLLFRILRTSRKIGPEEGITPDKSILALVERSSRADARLAGLGDKNFLRSPGGETFLMYGQKGGSLITMGDPVGPEKDWEELLWSFRELSDGKALRSVFYQISPERLDLYIDMGLQIVKFGEQGRVFLSGLSLEGSDRSGWRYSLNRGKRDGLSFRIVPPPLTEGLFGDLKIISDQWLLSKNVREKSFSLGSFKQDYLMDQPIALVEREGHILAFANLWVSGDKEEFAPDLMRYLDQAPNVIMEYLFLNLMIWGKEQGFNWFNMGMAPLSGLESRRLAPFWNHVGTLVFRHGEALYNFQGLRSYKEKFAPVWEPRYLAFPGRFALGNVLMDVTSLIAGDLMGVFRR